MYLQRIVAVLLFAILASMSTPVRGEVITFPVTAQAYELYITDAGLDGIRMAGTSVAEAVGAPRLPAVSYRLALPPDALPESVTVGFTDGVTEALTGIFRLPAETADAPQSGEARSADAAAWQPVDAFRPESPVRLVTVGHLRKWLYAEVLFFPFAYNEILGQLRHIASGTIVVSYSLVAEKTADAALADTVMDGEAAALFDNFGEARQWYPGETASEARGLQLLHFDYAIVTSNAVVAGSSRLDDFVAFLKSRGHSPGVFTETQWGAVSGQSPNHKAEKIRKWLQNNYLTWGITYVLLIGDPHPYESGEGDVPMKMCWPRRSYDTVDTESPTDAFYMDLTGNWDIDADGYYGEWTDFTTTGGVNFAPEVYVGRIPVYGGNYAALDAILDKTMRYRRELGTSWRRSILLPMSFSQATSDFSGAVNYDGAPLAAQMMADYVPAAWSKWTMYQQGGGACALNSVYASNEELRGGTRVRDRWAATPYGIVCWWGHGSSTSAGVGSASCWDGTLFSSSQTSSLNDGYPAFTYQCSCTNGYPESSGNLQYAILARGGVATVSASRVSWFNTGVGYGAFDGSSTNSGLGYEYVKRLVQGQTAAQALANAKLASLGDLTGVTRLMNYFDFNLYGDPDVALYDQGGIPPYLLLLN